MKRPFGKQVKYLLPNVSIVLCSWDSSTQENVNLKDKIKDNVKNIVLKAMFGVTYFSKKKKCSACQG
jgi:hypothetical protein